VSRIFDGNVVTDSTGVSRRFRLYSFKPVQIGVGGRVTQRTAHGNDLAFVMKGMRQDMMKDERRSADGDVPIGEMKFRIGIELLIGQVRQISMGQLTHFLLQESYIGDERAFFRGPVGVPEALERVNPKPLTVENMNRLFTQRGEAEAG
jgi:hypothetical protein